MLNTILLTAAIIAVIMFMIWLIWITGKIKQWERWGDRLYEQVLCLYRASIEAGIGSDRERVTINRLFSMIPETERKDTENKIRAIK